MAGEQELTQEEKDAAAKIDGKASDEKTKLDTLSDGMDKLLKSQVEQKEKDEADEEKPAFDIMDATVEDMAKSIMAKDEPSETIKEICDACNVLPQDMVDGEGNQFIDTDMMKSFEEASENGEKFMSGVLYAFQEMNERTAKKDGVALELLSMMAKSLTEIGKEVQELKKGGYGDGEKMDAKKKGDMDGEGDDYKKDGDKKMPDVGDGVSKKALSDESSAKSGTAKGYDESSYRGALKKSFHGSHGNDDERKKYYEYDQLLMMTGPESFLSSVRDFTDRNLIESNLQRF